MALLAKVTDADEKLRLEMIMANYMVNEGNVEDALNLSCATTAAKIQRAVFDVARQAAARSGDYQTAVGATSALRRRAEEQARGAKSLFQAAYLSYQFQDYDGAVRKFQQFAKANPKSGSGARTPSGTSPGCSTCATTSRARWPYSRRSRKKADADARTTICRNVCSTGWRCRICG